MSKVIPLRQNPNFPQTAAHSMSRVARLREIARAFFSKGVPDAVALIIKEHRRYRLSPTGLWTALREMSKGTQNATQIAYEVARKRFPAAVPAELFCAFVQSQLKDYGDQKGIRGLEGRLERGLDPTGMLAVSETAAKVTKIATQLGLARSELPKAIEFINRLHTGDIWKEADLLKAGKDPRVKLWLTLAYVTGHDKGRVPFGEREFQRDYERVNRLLDEVLKNPAGFASTQHARFLEEAGSVFEIKEGVAFSRRDVFASMAVRGECSGVIQADNGLLFVGADAFDYSALSGMGLILPGGKAVSALERGDVFVDGQGRQAVKYLGKGFAIVLKEGFSADEEGRRFDIAKALAKSAKPVSNLARLGEGRRAYRRDLPTVLSPDQALSLQKGVSPQSAKRAWEAVQRHFPNLLKVFERLFAVLQGREYHGEGPTVEHHIAHILDLIHYIEGGSIVREASGQYTFRALAEDQSHLRSTVDYLRDNAARNPSIQALLDTVVPLVKEMGAPFLEQLLLVHDIGKEARLQLNTRINDPLFLYAILEHTPQSVREGIRFADPHHPETIRTAEEYYQELKTFSNLAQREARAEALGLQNVSSTDIQKLLGTPSPEMAQAKVEALGLKISYFGHDGISVNILAGWISEEKIPEAQGRELSALIGLYEKTDFSKIDAPKIKILIDELVTSNTPPLTESQALAVLEQVLVIHVFDHLSSFTRVEGRPDLVKVMSLFHSLDNYKAVQEYVERYRAAGLGVAKELGKDKDLGPLLKAEVSIRFWGESGREAIESLLRKIERRLKTPATLNDSQRARIAQSLCEIEGVDEALAQELAGAVAQNPRSWEDVVGRLGGKKLGKAKGALDKVKAAIDNALEQLIT